MSDYGTEVKLLALSAPIKDYGPKPLFPDRVEDSEDLIEYAGRLCYNLEDKVGTNPSWIQSRIKDGHESILEHASATFYIRASRVLTHELVRHRIASYSQRSQRYVKESKPRYITPSELLEAQLEGSMTGLLDPGWVKASEVFRVAMEYAWAVYRDLLKAGVPREIARYVLPNACETQIVMTMNFRELRHFIKLRTAKRALPEMREVAGKVRDICKEIAPKVFGDL